MVSGTLPNGLRYVILPHGSRKGNVALRLIVRAGSLDEHDDERGFAHFVEHMAFKGTRTFPAGTVRLFFETLGVQFGADLNAYTNYTHTQYLLDLPAGRGDRPDEALILMRDYADGQLFLPDEVKRESKVVISEMAAGDARWTTPDARTVKDFIRRDEHSPAGSDWTGGTDDGRQLQINSALFIAAITVPTAWPW